MKVFSISKIQATQLYTAPDTPPGLYLYEERGPAASQNEIRALGVTENTRFWLKKPLAPTTEEPGVWPSVDEIEKRILALQKVGWAAQEAMLLAFTTSHVVVPGEPWPFTEQELARVALGAEGESSEQFLPLTSEDLGFYVIVDRASWLERLIPAGVRCFQLRIKDLTGEALREELARGIDLARSKGVRLWINDYAQEALEFGAWGVHLGQEDLARVDLKALAASGIRLGISTHNLFEVARALTFRPSYLACGTVFATSLKVMNSAPQGLGALRNWKSLLSTPVVAIGGITLADLGSVLSTGVAGVAVVSAVTQAKDPVGVAKSFVEGVQTYRQTGVLPKFAGELSLSEQQRYQPHILLPSVGLQGQQKLKRARVLCIGAGGLGSPLLLYLASAGVGTLGVMDGDRVELSNLQRQVLYRTGEVGKSKAHLTKLHLEELNSHCRVIEYPERLVKENALEIFRGYDVIADGSDNFATRYLVNHTCRALGLPLVSASVSDFQGQCGVFVPGGACYHCLFPSHQGENHLTTCRERGVLGVVPGVLGTIQATEVLKLLLGLGEPLSGRLLVLNTLTWEQNLLKVPRDPHCAVCSPSVLPPFAYEESVCTSYSISAQELQQRLKEGTVTLLDVRTAEEHEQFSLGGISIPLAELAEALPSLSRKNNYVVYCAQGIRSQKAVSLLRAQGYTAWSLQSGLKDYLARCTIPS